MGVADQLEARGLVNCSHLNLSVVFSNDYGIDPDKPLVLPVKIKGQQVPIFACYFKIGHTHLDASWVDKTDRNVPASHIER